MRAALTLTAILWASSAGAQTVSHTGFLEGAIFGFPERAPNDSKRIIGDGLFREELTLRPAEWFRLVGGLDLRANSHDQVDDFWRLDLEDRGLRRPRASIRRLAATLTHRGFTLDLGKQFIRWGRADIIYPTDRFAPRDYLNVVDQELLPVVGARAAFEVKSETFEGIWVPRLTPSRLPLITQRWAVIPPEAAGLDIIDLGSDFPEGAQLGARWRHTGSRLETALSIFDGFNHVPDLAVRARPETGAIEILRVYPSIRMYGADIAIPTAKVTLKAEAAYFLSPSATSDEYGLYVVEIERQIGEWVLDIGYAGETVRRSRIPIVSAPDRNLARSVIGRAAYTVDPRRSVVIEGAVRQTGEGYYGKIEYSQSMKQHWRVTLMAAGLGGEVDDFLGQYRRNSHASLTIRFSY